MKPLILLANKRGQFFEDPRFTALGMEGESIVSLTPEDLIPLPKGSKIFLISDSIPLGLDNYGLVRKIDKFYPVAAFLPPGFTRTHLPAFIKTEKAPTLPLWSYTAVAWYRNSIYAAAVEVASMRKADPDLHDDREVYEAIKISREKFKNNRVAKQLEICALIYNCFAAKNLFLRRWEAPLPTSPSCNARCIGCLSLQSGDCCPSQARISFVPEPKEIAEIATFHLESAEEAVVSFGQGCEGEPLLQTDTIAKAIAMIRAKTQRGVININTNGSMPEMIEKLKKAGLDSIRISINSFNEDTYNGYYRPKGYKFEDVLNSLRKSTDLGLFTSINYLIFPGYSDAEEEIESLFSFLESCPVDLIQFRNLSIDPYVYIKAVPKPAGMALGVRKLIELIKRRFPHVRIGYFNLPKEALNGEGKERCYFI